MGRDRRWTHRVYNRQGVAQTKLERATQYIESALRIPSRNCTNGRGEQGGDAEASKNYEVQPERQGRRVRNLAMFGFSVGASRKSLVSRRYF